MASHLTLWDKVAATSALLLVTVFIGYMFTDRPLNKSVVEIEDTYKQAIGGESEAYLYLMGIGAPKTLLPADAGRKFIHRFREEPDESGFENIEGAYDDEVLVSPVGEVYCAIRESGCALEVFNNSHVFRDELKIHGVLLKRFKKLLSFDGYQLMLAPTVNAPLPDYHYVMRGNRLYVFQAILAAQGRELDLAFDLLAENISRIKVWLKNSQSLIDKMVFATLLSENIDFLAVLSSQNPSASKVFIPELDRDEMSFDLAINNEMLMAFQSMEVMTERKKETVVSQFIYDTLISVVFKSNMTKNSIFTDYERIKKMAKIESSEFDQSSKELKAQESNKFSLRNLAGYYILREGTPEYISYVSSFFALNEKIHLYNGEQTKLKAEVCHEGFFKAQDHFRCLNIGLSSGVEGGSLQPL